MKRKHTEDIPEEEQEEEDLAVDEATEDIDDDGLSLKSLARLSGLKLLSAVCGAPPKEFCKLITSASGPIDLCCGITAELVQTIEKYGEGKKIEKLEHKIAKLDNPFLFSCNGELFKTYLKYGMKKSENAQTGHHLISILNALFSVSSRSASIESPTLGIQMLLSHSKAAEIFLEASGSNQKKTVEKPEEKFRIIKEELLKLWLRLITVFADESTVSGTEEDKKILETSIPFLMQIYGATMSSSDQIMFEILTLYASPKLGITIESMPLFGPKCFETPPPGASNPLYAHSTRANTILTSISDTKAYYTAFLYDPSKLGTTGSTYDMRFLLPLLCHVLDEKNICDGSKVVANGWIYFIARGMGLEDETLRAEAFLAFQRLVQNFQQTKAHRSQDVKIWLHFLIAVKRGIVQMGECKISNLLSTWMVATWEVLRQPSHSMFQKVTTSLFAKPTIEMTILPDFIPFYNDGDDNKESRTWILNVLYQGLNTRDDWKIAQKLPTIKFLCSSFIFEKVKTQKSIVGILIHGARLPEVAEEMTDKYSIPLWLANLSTTSKSLKIDLEFFFQTLVKNCPPTEMRSKIFEFVSRKQNWSLISTGVWPRKDEGEEAEEPVQTETEPVMEMDVT